MVDHPQAPSTESLGIFETEMATRASICRQDHGWMDERNEHFDLDRLEIAEECLYLALRTLQVGLICTLPAYS